MQYREASDLTLRMRQLANGGQHGPQKRSLSRPWPGGKAHDIEAKGQQGTDRSRQNLRNKSTYDLVRSWSMAHSFLAVMGGFVVADDPDSLPVLPEDHDHLTITPDGLIWILEMCPGITVDSSAALIRSTSSSDSFSKVLILVQGEPHTSNQTKT